ncbi:hypothetical protein LguiB_020407 [Lonicera macranthoides]
MRSDNSNYNGNRHTNYNGTWHNYNGSWHVNQVSTNILGAPPACQLCSNSGHLAPTCPSPKILKCQ